MIKLTTPFTHVPIDEIRNPLPTYPLTILETPYNKEFIDKIGNSFWEKDLMTVVTINKNL